MTSLMIAQWLSDLIAPIAAAVGLALAGFISQMLISFLRKLRDKVGLEADIAAEAAVENAVERSILKVQQTFVDALKHKSADGQLTKEEAVEALKLARAEALAQLSVLADKENPVAKQLTTDLEALTNRIEALIPVVKKKTTVGMQGLTKEEAQAIVDKM